MGRKIIKCNGIITVEEDAEDEVVALKPKVHGTSVKHEEATKEADETREEAGWPTQRYR